MNSEHDLAALIKTIERLGIQLRHELANQVQTIEQLASVKGIDWQEATEILQEVSQRLRALMRALEPY
jgi:two-component sensor histidine kinase